MSNRRAALYVRQSIHLTEGIDRQTERCRLLAQSRGYEVAGIYSDNDTSATKERGDSTAWARMLRDATAGRIDTIIAVDLDRLLRSLRDLQAVTKTGAAVLTVDGELDLTTADGEFRASLSATLAQFETRRKGERQLRANAYRASKAMPNPGRRRYGYESNGRDIRESEAVVVRSLFERFREGASVRSLALDLIARGVNPAPGRSWSNGRVRYILSSEVYAGYAIHKGQATRSELVAPIVSEELASEVRALLSDPTRRTTPGPGVKHLMSGLAKCGVCGATMFYMRAYRCRADTTHPSITKDRMDSRIRREVMAALITAPSSVTGSDAGDGIPALVSRIAANHESVAQVLQDRDEGLIPPDVARARLVTLRTAREAAEGALEAARAASATGVFGELRAGLFTGKQASFADAAERAERMGEAFDALDLDRQRELIRTLLAVEVDPGRDLRRIRVHHLVATTLNPDE